MVEYKTKLIVGVLIIVFTVASLFHLFPLSQWLFALIGWADTHSGFLELLGLIITVITIILGGIRYNLKTKKGPLDESDPQLRTLEHSYLHQLENLFEEMRRHPLVPDEAEILELQAELVVEPKYRVFPVLTQDQDRPSKGKLTSDLVGTLLKAEAPVVILGEPGSGKSVSLLKVMLELVRQGLKQASPKIPIYLRLGTFTQPITDKNTEAIVFTRETLKTLGGHAEHIQKELDRYLTEGRVIFLLDAMDEMPRDHIQERFEALSRLRNFTPNKILLACRKLDFPETFPFQRAIIQPFDRNQIRRFLKRTLGAKSKIVYKEILSPSNQLRDMASNPFFLKLLSLFYQELERLPTSRAELIQMYETQVFERAKSRATFSPQISLDTFRSVLSRLAYLITISRRGVTIPIDDFISKFAPVPAVNSESRLLRFKNEISEVLHIAMSERLLRVDKERSVEQLPANHTREIVSFYHHRLQEYYTAVYLEDFKPAFEWENRFDDIWWQEILIMLFGIAKQPALHMELLLQSIPDRAILCPELGPLLYDVIKSNSASARRSLLDLDNLDYYGLKEVFDHPDNSLDLLPELKNLGILHPSDSDFFHLRQLSPEPDRNEYADWVRQWLENLNSTLLERLDLGVECYRNALSKMSQKTADLFVMLLSAFVKDGNMGEAVRAIQISSRLPGIDIYAIVEKALLQKDAWCRSEAISAIAKYPIEANTFRKHTGFIIFLQFMKGELLFSLPQFLRSLIELPRLAYFLPGILLLTIISALLIVSPAIFYEILITRYPAGLFGLPGKLGLGWPTWAFGITCLVGLWIYLSRLQGKVPIVRSTVFACALGIFLPEVINLIADPLGGRLPSDQLRLFSPYQRLLYEWQQLLWLGLGVVVSLMVIFAPQIFEAISTSVLSPIFSLVLGTARILRAPIIYVREIMSNTEDYLWGIQKSVAILLTVGFLYYAAFLLALTLMAPAFVIGFPILIVKGIHDLLRMVRDHGLLLSVRKIIRSIDFHEITRGLLTFLGVFVGFGGLILLLIFLWPLFLKELLLFLWKLILTYLGPIALAALILLGIFLTLKTLIALVRDAMYLVIVFYRRLLGLRSHRTSDPLGFDPTSMRDPEILMRVDEIVRQDEVSSQQRFDILRTSLRYIRSSWVRSIIYREMAKIRKEIRQATTSKDS
jgi:hypothetical protein